MPNSTRVSTWAGSTPARAADIFVRQCRESVAGSDVSDETRPPSNEGRTGCAEPGQGPADAKEDAGMKYVILIHSNPDPWGHPTASYTT